MTTLDPRWIFTDIRSPMEGNRRTQNLTDLADFEGPPKNQPKTNNTI